MTRRRGHHEGSIYRRTDGRWAAAVDLGWAGGKRQRKSLYGKTRAEVAAKLRAAMRAHEDGLPPGDERLTVDRFLADWLAVVAQTVRPSTLRSYTMIVERHLTPALGRYRLRRLTPELVQRYMTAKLKEGKSARTVQYHHAVLRAALESALRLGLASRNVAKLVSPPTVKRAEVQPLTAEEAQRLLAAIRGDRLEAVVAVALTVGLRQGEILALGWSDVDLDSGELRVRHTLHRRAGAFALDEPKSAQSRRAVSAPTPLRELLRKHRTRQIEERLAAGPAWQGEPWRLVFTNAIGAPLHGSAVTRRFQKLLAAAGLPRQRFHDLRHASASFQLAQGVDLRVVQEVLGHSTITLTANTYTHVMRELQKDATDRVAQVLWGRS